MDAKRVIPVLQFSFRVDDAMCIYSQPITDTRSFGERVLRFIYNRVACAPTEVVSLYTAEYDSPKFHILPGTFSITYRDKAVLVEIMREHEVQNLPKWYYTVKWTPQRPWTQKQVDLLFLDIKAEEPPATLSTLVYTSEGWEPIAVAPVRTRETTFFPKGLVDRAVTQVQHFLSKTPVKWKISRSYTILLQGPPGTGKTTYSELLASLLGYQMAIMQFDPKISDRELFQIVAELPERTLLLIEDIDCTFVERKAKDKINTRISFSGLLNMLDGVASKADQIIIMTTNHLTQLDPALVREGRVNLIESFGPVVKYQAKEMMKAMLPSQNFDLFWTKAHHLKFSAATLYNWFLRHLETKNIMDHWDDFKARLTDVTKGKSNPELDHLYA